MVEKVFDFLKQHSSLVLTTHENPDPDGIGAEMVFSQLAETLGKQIRIINPNPTPEKYRFIDPENKIETWDQARENLPRGTALVILDTADENNIGKSKVFIPMAADGFFIDHHEQSDFCLFDGIIDSKASSTCELTVELALAAGIKLTPANAKAAFAGIAYDTGFFAYPKTTARTFKAALALIEAGVIPYEIYKEFYRNSSMESLLLEKAVFSSLDIINRGRLAIQVIRKEDLEKYGASLEETENFVSTPLKCKGIEVSVLAKESRDGLVRCALRSKGSVNVAKVAQNLGGGGHATAAGFRSSLSLDETVKQVTKIISRELGL